MADTLYIYGDIGYEITAADFSARLDSVNPDKAIDVRISSAGGEVFDGFTIANRLRNHSGKVTAYVDGLAASMATVIALAADRVVMARDAWWMIHNPQAVFASGDADALRSTADNMDNVAARLRDVYARKTGIPLAELTAMMDAETWLDADAALASGFIDEINEPRHALAAHAGFLKVERFANPPKLKGKEPMKSKLSMVIRARLDSVATDATARDALVNQIVSASGADLTTLEMLLDGSTLVTPTREILEACAGVLGITVASLEAAAAEDFEIQAAPAAPDPAPAAEPAPATLALQRAEGAAVERTRMLELRGLFDRHPGNESLLDDCLRLGRTVEQASVLLLDRLGSGVEPVTPVRQPHVTVVEHQRDKFKAGAAAALLGRTSDSYRRKHADDLARNEFAGFSLMELSRHACDVAGVRITGMDRFEIVGQSFTTSDFPQILADVAHKSMMIGFDEAPETWSMWARSGSLQDFKPHKRAALSEYDDLLLINNGSEEFKRGEFTDLGEDIKAETWGRLFSITRQAIINDDANAFTGIPTAMGRAANRKVGDEAYNLLFNGQVSSETGNTTYHANHNNLVAADLDSPGLDAARAAMATQPGPLNTEKAGASGAQALNIRPAYLIVPVALEGVATSVINAQFEFVDSDKDSQRPNPVRNLATPVADARMDNLDANAWILAASSAQHPTIEVGFLDGNAAPRLEQQDRFTTDGTDFKVAIDFGVRVLDWRGLYKSTGST